jgi:GH24 family phage-related lysozyme (muramidase)
MAFSEKALKLILDFEGLNQPGKWPGGRSGITLGYGYDLGFVTARQFELDWAGAFTPAEIERLKQAIGKTGAAAKALAPTLADIRSKAADARRVLLEVSIPTYVERTRRAFPGFDLLPLDVQGALVSLVYNRGAGMKDSAGTDNRKEMRAIRDLVASGMIAGIAEQLRSMKRLWTGQGLAGLLRRRDAEAALVESTMAALMRALRAIPGEVGRGLRRAGRALAAQGRTRRKTSGRRKRAGRAASRPRSGLAPAKRAGAAVRSQPGRTRKARTRTNGTAPAKRARTAGSPRAKRGRTASTKRRATR